MKNYDLPALITALGGRQALQDLLAVGPSAVSNYLARGELPQRAHAPVCEALRRRGYEVDPGTLQITGQTTGQITGQIVGQIVGHTSGQTATTLPQRDSRSVVGQARGHEPRGRRVLLIVGGGIAAYKALEVARRLQDHNIDITGVMTSGAEQFITPLSLAALTARQVYTNLFSLTDEAEMGHIRLARQTDLVLVAPATANLMARTANGLADDLATTILLATTAPVLMAPAMNPMMWQHPATTENVARLAARGVQFVGPSAGDMACGEDGVGRLAEPQEIVDAVCTRLASADMDTPATNVQPDLQPALRPEAQQILQSERSIGSPAKSLVGRHAIVTSGPTIEPIDTVRFIANRSSGKQGHAIAAALAERGARVTLVSGPVPTPAPANVKLMEVQSAADMLAACEAALPADIAICAAAVADWRVENASDGKLKKQKDGEPPTLKLVENPDILATLSRHAQRPRLVVGFAAEATNLKRHAGEKLARKGCDWIVANAVTRSDGSSVFNSDTNSATLMTRNDSLDWPLMSKQELAEHLVDEVEHYFLNQPATEKAG